MCHSVDQSPVTDSMDPSLQQTQREGEETHLLTRRNHSRVGKRATISALAEARKGNGEITMELVNEKDPSAALVLTHFHVDLFRKVYIGRSVTNALLRSLLEEDYMDLMASLISLRKRCQCFRSVVDRESGYHVLLTFFLLRLLSELIFSAKCLKFIFLKIVSSLTLVILAVRLNCSQITSTLGLSKQINVLDFF